MPAPSQSIVRVKRAFPRFAAALVGALAAFGAAQAQAADAGHPVVVELFQSQGCSSCPPANANLNAISQRADVLALSFSVTYWDSLGWKDTFAKGQFTDRQWQYAHAMHQDNVYTPQVVVNGRVAGVGAERGEIEALIGKGERRWAPRSPSAAGVAEIDARAGAGREGANARLVRYDLHTPTFPSCAAKTRAKALCCTGLSCAELASGLADGADKAEGMPSFGSPRIPA